MIPMVGTCARAQRKEMGMKIGKTSRPLFLLVVLFAASISADALGDGAMPATILSLVQVGQDVKVEIDFSPDGVIRRSRLSCENNGDVAYLLDDVIPLDLEIEEHSYCNGWTPCVEDGGVDCDDCDGDGIEECGESCSTSYLFYYWHACVSPGENRYSVSFRKYTGTDKWEEVDKKSIFVEDTDVDCSASDKDAGTADGGEAESDEESDSESDEGSREDQEAHNDESSSDCAIVAAGRDTAPHVLALIMIAIGLVAARVGRKK
jgi:hypothetical protein